MSHFSSRKERRRSEQALSAVVQEAFINGVSTRRIERLALAMGNENVSSAQVSEFNRDWDAQVAEFRGWLLEKAYSFLWIDALYQKVRVEGRVVSVAVLVACGVNRARNREFLAVEPCSTNPMTPGACFFESSRAGA